LLKKRSSPYIIKPDIWNKFRFRSDSWK